MTEPLVLRSDLVAAFLRARAWVQVRAGDLLVEFAAPASLELSADFALAVPVTSEGEGAQHVLRSVASTVALIYGVSPADLFDAFTGPHTVLGVRLAGEDTALGSVSFGRFEGLVEALRKVIIDTADFVISGLPIGGAHLEQSQSFFNECRFLPTTLGSFVTRVQLPDNRVLRDSTLFDQEPLMSATVPERLGDILDFVATKVLPDDRSIYEEEFLLEASHLISLDVLEGVSDVLRSGDQDAIDFSFASASAQRRIAPGRISVLQHHRLSQFIEFVRERVEGVIDVDVRGRIVRLHSRNPLKNRNYIAVLVPFEGRETLIGVMLRSVDYAVALQAHRENRRVRLAGRAQRLKTQLSMISLEILEPQTE